MNMVVDQSSLCEEEEEEEEEDDDAGAISSTKCNEALLD